MDSVLCWDPWCAITRVMVADQEHCCRCNVDDGRAQNAVLVSCNVVRGKVLGKRIAQVNRPQWWASFVCIKGVDIIVCSCDVKHIVHTLPGNVDAGNEQRL